ncbi:hypothetical protein [Mesorhizobium sp. ES1-1]|uniref:hypothetical protein n=1 Tax=Mesorhizobium sp. ES1-1 TaxID=2876629 RepID=UPI001CCA897C|nr:hypothetical protein [Mesorhizobium sp. ES1-1]MBZ9678827.1 hypothetical protein [Mesorhizobium sp. ES1-1]
MTVADMNRLEHAARISMGGFQDTEAALPSFGFPTLRSSPLAAMIAITAMAIAALFQLLR